MPTATGHVFTINNYTEVDIAAVLACECLGVKVGKEVGASGTPHLQGAVYWGAELKCSFALNITIRDHHAGN